MLKKKMELAEWKDPSPVGLNLVGNLVYPG